MAMQEFAPHLTLDVIAGEGTEQQRKNREHDPGNFIYEELPLDIAANKEKGTVNTAQIGAYKDKQDPLNQVEKIKETILKSIAAVSVPIDIFTRQPVTAGQQMQSQSAESIFHEVSAGATYEDTKRKAA